MNGPTGYVEVRAYAELNDFLAAESRGAAVRRCGARSGRNREDAISAEAAEISRRRGAIEQTKGMLMVVYGIDQDAAFNLLKSLSQVHNVKLGLLAEQIAQDFSTLGEANSGSRPQFDQLLLTAHLRAGDQTDGAAV